VIASKKASDMQLTLRFTLPLKTPVAGTASLEVYDPTYFVAFSLTFSTVK
jgi:ABC-type uncharacterized transport system substrate-binding protein